MVSWQRHEYDILFADRPPTESRAPSAAECKRLGELLGRSGPAVLAQWNDGRSLVLRHRNDASRALREYLVDRGWL